MSISANMTDYLIDKATGRVVEGDWKKKDVERVWTFLLREGSGGSPHRGGQQQHGLRRAEPQTARDRDDDQVRKEAEGKKKA